MTGAKDAPEWWFVAQFERSKKALNADYCKQALEKVINPNILVNVVSRRVRQLSSGGGGSSRPLIQECAGMGWADIALLEIATGKLGWEMLEDTEAADMAAKKRKKP
jgi:DNA-directed RNA polymerase subunit omega